MKKIQAILLTGLMVLAMTITTSTSTSAQSRVRTTTTTASKVQPPQRVPPQCGTLTESICLPAPIGIIQLAGILITVTGLVR
jgi:hypothetical protein